MFVPRKYAGKCKRKKIERKSRGEEKKMKQNENGVEIYILILGVTI